MMAATHQHAGSHQFAQFPEEPSPPYTDASARSAFSATSDHSQFETPPAKRHKISLDAPPSARTDGKRGSSSAISTDNAPMTADRGVVADLGSASSVIALDHGADATASSQAPVGGGQSGSAAVATKSKRVRTGCLTCRERHLKCDEGLPDCHNCRKSSRECKRGVRLNFIDVRVENPPYLVPATDWSVQFHDESREIASEYQGGLQRYAPFDQRAITPPRETDLEISLQQHAQTEGANAAGSLASNSNHAMSMPAAQPVFYPGPGRQLHSDQIGFGDGTLEHLRDLNTRRENEAFLTVGHEQQPSYSGPLEGTFTLASLQGQFAVKDDITRTHVHRTSDGSSIASSLIPHSGGAGSASFPAGPSPGQTYHPDGLMTPPIEQIPSGDREYLGSEDEIAFMQLFVQDVGVWMDCLDNNKHFTRIIPYLALKSPMLLNAFLACGVKHKTLVEPDYSEDKALLYYDTATTQLLASLRNPDRNMAECATTAVVLNVYEIMSEKPTQRMSHIAGARALIRECGWNARSTGIGGACFWLNIGMEVLSCLSFNWQTAWDPDQWGLDLEFTNLQNANASSSACSEDGGVGYAGGSGGGGGAGLGVVAGGSTGNRSNSLGGGGEEEMWVHRIFYIVAKIANFRANIPRFQEPSAHDEQVRLQTRFTEWKRLKGLCDWWNNNCPRPMRPFGYLRKASKSAFPNVWLIKRAAIVGRLFYHTAMCLLAQINPLNPRSSEDNIAVQQHHAHQVCGIVAHTEDRGVASISIRSLTIASSVLTDRREQEEVLQILDKINKSTGWRLGKVLVEVKRAWGWEGHAPQGGSAGGTKAMTQQFFATSQPPQQQQGSSLSAPAPVSTPPPITPLINPLLVQADFSLPNHPYQNWYEPPNRTNTYNSHGIWPG